MTTKRTKTKTTMLNTMTTLVSDITNTTLPRCSRYAGGGGQPTTTTQHKTHSAYRQLPVDAWLDLKSLPLADMPAEQANNNSRQTQHDPASL
jgi:hypothetical protein